ncbi:MAG TPA: hypothetical protein DEG09_05865 [Marinilabiliaceae bacterium]|nr:hypothetical protein [Marinilabiliaceae bacterium]
MKTKIIVLFLFALIAFSFSDGTEPRSENTEFSVKLIVDFGESKPGLTLDITSNRRLTALEVLQHATVVETHPVGKYVFVSAIDGLSTIRGDKAWYYKVNGTSPGVIAINNRLNNGDTVCWMYKKDVCSQKVDN